jgi:diguanylate cyclase (GGDEF)-like protein
MGRRVGLPVRAGAPHNSRRDQELLDAVWEALNIARDNKALLVAREGSVVNANHLACQLCGRSLDALLGRNVLGWLLEDEPTRHSSSATERWETTLNTATGDSVAVEVTRQALGNRFPGMVAYAIRDLRERYEAAETRERQNQALRQREEELEAQNVKFDAALENMLQGLAMFDAEQRLIVCNRRYAEMYGLTAEQVKPGTTVRQIFDYRLANGHYHVKDTASFVGSWADDFGAVSSRIQELADGRIVCVTRRRMANGGRLVTHEDITERRRLDARLEQQHALLETQEKQLRAQNVQLDAALNNIVQGIAMFDAQQRLVISNARYAEIYELSAEQVKPGITLLEIIQQRIKNGLTSEKVPEDIVNSMLSRRDATGFEQFYNQLSDGRCIAITVQPMADGGTVTTHQDITEQRRSAAKIAHMALHDTLTGLPNRVLLNERLEHALSRVRRGEIVATHIFDLDHFKTVNDTLGHPAGDKLLTTAADRLRTLVRETDTIARMGGDEFAIVQVGISQPADATSLAQRIISVVSEPYDIDGHQVVVGASVGIAVGPADGTTPEQIIRNADLALYRAKGDGRGTYRFFEQEMDAQMQARRELESDLRKALTGGEFELYYQPVVDLASSAMTGLEALIRWRHPSKGMISPDTFIPLAEEIGLIVPIGEWALRQACTRAAQWPSHLKIAVNLSPVQFRNPGLVQTIVGALASSGLAPERLELEITEAILLQDTETTLSMLYRLRELGVRIAMDDFGTGYSSLSYLQSFPFDKIKIDRSFVRDIAESSGSLNIVRAVAALAKGLGMTATAEGVETAQQLDTVRAEGCTEMQGYLFSRPLPAHEVEKLFLSQQCDRDVASGFAAA